MLGEEARSYVLQDFSWYSPLLSARLSDVAVDVIVFPRAIEQLEFAIEASVRMNGPINHPWCGHRHRLPVVAG